jgi:hypothetical protein
MSHLYSDDVVEQAGDQLVLFNNNGHEPMLLSASKLAILR